MAVRAVDVSEHNGSNDWPNVRGVRLAFARAGFGNDREDLQWRRNIKGIKARSAKTVEQLLSPCSGLRCVKPADYWYCYPSSANDGATEGDRHCDVLEAVGIYDTHLVGVDIEEHGHLTKTEMATYTAKHIDRVGVRLQRRGVLYMGISFAQNYLPANWTVPDGWLTWVPWYGPDTKPTLASARRVVGGDLTRGTTDLINKMLLWQYTDGLIGKTPRSFKGIGRCDVSEQTRGTENDLIHYGCKR